VLDLARPSGRQRPAPLRPMLNSHRLRPHHGLQSPMTGFIAARASRSGSGTWTGLPSIVNDRIHSPVWKAAAFGSGSPLQVPAPLQILRSEDPLTSHKSFWLQTDDRLHRGNDKDEVAPGLIVSLRS
jgi:hypothetical protein